MAILSDIYGFNLINVTAYLLAAPVLWGTIAFLLSRRWLEILQIINILFFIGYISVILYLTLFSRRACTHDLVLIPFHFLIEAQKQPELYRSMLMNVFLFMPYGLSLPFALPTSVLHQIPWTVASAMLFSLLIEVTQYCFQLGRAEVDDVIMNTLGALIGCFAFLSRNQLKNLQVILKLKV